MLHIVRWCSILCVLLGAPAVAQAQSVVSGPADPPGDCVSARRRDRYPCAPAHAGAGRGARPIGHHREQAGAGGYIAWNYVAAADPDGYTLLMAENAVGISQALHKKASSPFDPLKHYDAIATVATSPLVLAAANNVKADSVAELIAYSRSVPQK